MLKRCQVLSVLICCCSIVFSQASIARDKNNSSNPASTANEDFQTWLNSETTVATQSLFQNISPSGTSPGVVIASPQKANPDYYYHWVRDAALTMNVVFDLYKNTSNSQDQNNYFNTLSQFVSFSHHLQETPNPSGPAEGLGLGEPKFNVDGTAFTGAWGRPQSDGPALRAITLINLANNLLDSQSAPNQTYVTGILYDSALPTHSEIKLDLEYVAHNWQNPAYDLWEEVEGSHFYTQLVQRRALRMGADLANRLGDTGAAGYYNQQAALLENALAQHWDPAQSFIGETLNRVAGLGYKTSNIDMGVLLGVLHADLGPVHSDDFFSPADDRVLATALKTEQAFSQLYGINQITANQSAQPLGVAIGRYPEDNYNGVSSVAPLDFDGIPLTNGNPWVLCTLGMGEIYYRASAVWAYTGSIAVSQINLPFLMDLLGTAGSGLQVGQVISAGDDLFSQILTAMREKGDSFVRRVQYHNPGDGSLAEQMNRTSGAPQSASNLTWSYASFLTASWSRPATY